MTVVSLANGAITIEQALRWCEVSAWEGGGGKLHCPFGPVAHSDGGAERALRAYSDNKAHCFACAKTWTPVSMMAEWWDCSRDEAADRMLRMSGLTAPDWREQWEQAHLPRRPDIAALGEALKTWCRRVRGPAWDQEQFGVFARPLADCLGLISMVTTDEEANQALDSCKLVMATVFHGGR